MCRRVCDFDPASVYQFLRFSRVPCANELEPVRGDRLSYQNISATAGEGADYLLLSFAATMVGGVNMYGGAGSIFGVLVGVLCLASITSALTIAGVPPAIYPGVLGVFVLAVVLDQARLRR